MDFSFFKDERYLRCFVLKDRETDATHQDLDYLDLYFVELEKFEKKHQVVKTTLERWIKFLNNADYYSRETLPQELAQVEAIKKASEKLDVMYLNKKERQYYDAQQKRYLDESSRIREAVDKAVQEAVQEAELAKQLEIAKRLIALGLDNATIAQGTNLSLEQIEQLRRDV